MKQIGFDFFMIDMESGAYTLETAADIIRAGRLLDLCPLVRVVAPEYHLLAPVLDQGAMGLMAPRIGSRADVEALLSAMKYPPAGRRGCSALGPHTDFASLPIVELLEGANHETLAIAQIELKEAVEQIDELLAVPGLDVALIGPQDLSISLGVPGEVEHPRVTEAMEAVLTACERHGVVFGLHTGQLEMLRRWMPRGLRMVMYSSELGFMLAGGREGLRRLKQPPA
jgi:2-dehydro-3-deoxyglucarate aldolase/4-hydroxy-2-oxoheptanedioate aldolase